MYGKRYTPAQKAAYYKRIASSGSSRSYGSASGRTRGTTKAISGSGNYATRFRSNYRKPYRYPGAGGRYGSAAGSAIGNIISPGIGGIVGGGIGRQAGRLAHAGLKTITGFGDYDVKANSVLYNKDAVPQFSSENPRCTIISHSEFIKDIQSSTQFKNQSFNISASNPECFPWLSQIATNFEQVVWQGLVFQYKPTCGDAISSSNNALGTVVAATCYNVLDAPFVNKQQMENYEFAVSGKPCDALMHAIECDPKLTAMQGLFYNSDPGATNIATFNAAGYVGDPRLYNLGRFNLATVGMQAGNVTIGELWVTYKVCLLKPKLTGQVNFADSYTLQTADLDVTQPFGSTPVVPNTGSTSYLASISGQLDQMMTAFNRNPFTELAFSLTSLYINPSFTGRVIVVYQLHGSTTVASSDPTFSTLGNCSILTGPDNYGGGYAAYDKAGSSTAPTGSPVADVFCAIVLQVNGGYDTDGNGPQLVFDALSWANAGNPTGHLAIYSIQSNINASP